jgi:hypothetical protein
VLGFTDSAVQDRSALSWQVTKAMALIYNVDTCNQQVYLYNMLLVAFGVLHYACKV